MLNRELESLGIPMEIYLKGNGKKENRMEKVY
jgi:hypothetical protein